MKLLSPKGAQERVIHIMIGTLGQLFDDITAPIAIPKSARKLRVYDCEKEEHQIFDTHANQWIKLSKELYDSIPNTFTFAPRPTNLDMELDYFVRGCGLLKHSFIWSLDSIPKSVFEKIASKSNTDCRGRYTLTPWLPPISRLGRMERGFYVMNNADWMIIYE